MTTLYLLASMLAAVAFYLASAHQRLWPHARTHAVATRWLAWASTALAVFAAIRAMGIWAGVFAALTAIMLALVLLPYADAWRHLRRSRADVG